jgi:SAM-dependent methyltransferase
VAPSPTDLIRTAWNAQVDRGNPWTLPVTAEQIDRARKGDWGIQLTATKRVPRSWFPSLDGCRVLCLASGGGQQGPILAAAGARVTVFDISSKQLARDREVAEANALAIETVEGEMADLGYFADESFDLIVHPVSNCFVTDVNPVWRECARVLRPRGALLAGFCNPVRYLFAVELDGTPGPLEVRNTIPYSDLESLSEAHRERFLADGEPFEFGHTLDDQLGGQLRAGLVVTHMYEDRDPPGDDPLSRYIDSYVATRAIRGSV